MKTQAQRILVALMSGDKLTALDALDRFGCFRLAARIDELRKDGWQIETENVKAGSKSFARYFMHNNQPATA